MTNYCNLCHDTLLRHISNQELYWFCPSCRQAMPREQAQFSTLEALEPGILSDHSVPPQIYSFASV